MTETTKAKIRAAHTETADALIAFHKLQEGVTVRKINDTIRTLQAVTAKLECVKLELAASEERERQ